MKAADTGVSQIDVAVIVPIYNGRLFLAELCEIELTST